MKVKLLVSRSGPNGTQNAGDEVNVNADEGKRMIAADQAVLVRSSKSAEKAVKS